MVGGVSRRRVLAGSAGVAAGLVIGTRPVAAVDRPAGFPAGVELERQIYRNWAEENTVPGVLVCFPKTAGEVVEVADWALTAGYRLRAAGYRHGWSPLTITTDDPDTTVLVDTRRHLRSVQVGQSTVRAQAGASMDDLLERLGAAGLGLAACPAPGDLTVGGVLAIDAHGTAIPAAGEQPVPGQGYGSLSSLVPSLTAVVFDATAGGYALRTVDRGDPDHAALATQLGRGFVTEATIEAGADQNLRCVSRVDIPAAELFAAPGAPGANAFAGFVERAGRVEAIWYPFTTSPWLKVWSVSPSQPLGSRTAPTPYNYPFSDEVPRPVADLAARLVSGEWYLAPAFGQAQYDATATGLVATLSADLWGPSRNLLRYVRPTTLHVTANGYAVHTRRADMQRVVADFAAIFEGLLLGYQAAGSYPMNGPVEIRVTGLDGPGAPLLSALRPFPGHPEWDVAVWLDVLTIPGTPDAHRFYRDLEVALYAAFAGGYAAVRPEWSKGWAYTADAGWADPAMLHAVIPGSFDTWHRAVSTLDSLDPHRVFSNTFLDGFLTP
jgi:FAD/FMN-containing dehydrogenase